MRIPGNFDRWMFNYKEGNLSAEEAAYFENNVLSNPDYADDIEAWDNAFVRQTNIQYPNTNSLLKEAPFYAKWRNWAAALLLLLGIGGGVGIGTSILKDQKQTYQPRFSTNLISATTNYNSLSSETTTSDMHSSAANVDPSLTGQLSGVSSNPYAIANKTRSTTNPYAANNNVGGDGFATGDESSNQYQFQNYHSHNAKSNQKANRKVEADKIKGTNSNYGGTYYLNPAFDISPVDIEINKSKTSLLAYRLKRLWRKIDKITGYPVALVNLRDPDLLIPNKNLLNFNPGFTGSSGNFRMGADYRNQWTGESVNSQLSTLYFDTYSKSSRGGIGGSIVYGDYRNGAYQNMTANVYYSPKFVINKHIVFEPAIKATIGKLARNVQKNNGAGAIEFDRGNVISQSGIDVANSNNSWFKDYGVGFVLNTDWFYVGAFVDNLTQHDQRIYKPGADNIIASPRLLTGVIGFDYQSRNKRTTLSPFLSYYQYGLKKEAWAGATAQFNWLTIGASYSSNSEYAASVGLKFKSFKLSYQLDMTESEFLQESFVSHNIGIRFNTKNKTIR